MKPAERTKILLRKVTDHLSYREVCRGVEYEVHVEDDTIRFYPEVFVFPDRHHRRDSDKIPVIEHVLKHHMAEVFVERLNTASSLKVEPGTFVNGKYQYQLSFDKKRRRWTKVE